MKTIIFEVVPPVELTPTLKGLPIGIPGHTPYIPEGSTTWWINGVDTGKKAIAVDGDDAILPENIVIDPDYVHTDNNFTDEEKTLLSAQSGVNTGDQDLSIFYTKSEADTLFDSKVNKITGYSLVADAEILKIHSRNTDSTLLSENGLHSVYVDNSGVFHVKDISQVGTAYETHAEQLFTTKNEIILRDGAVAGLSVGEYVGFRAKLYDGVNDGHFVFDKDGWARVGDVGSLQKLATIEETTTNGWLMKYNASTLRLEGFNPALLPVSTAMQNALDLKANLSGGNSFSGTQSFASYFGLTDVFFYRNAAGRFEINNGTAGTLRDLKLRSLYGDKIIPNSDTTGVVIRNAADSADVVNVDTQNKRVNINTQIGATPLIIKSSNTNSFYDGEHKFEITPSIGAGSDLKFTNNGRLILSPQELRINCPMWFTNGIDWLIYNIFNIKGISSMNFETDYNNIKIFTAGRNQDTVFHAYTGKNVLLAPYSTSNQPSNNVAVGTSNPETKLDINGTTTHRDWTYFNNGTHTGDAVGDFRAKVLSGVLTFQKCDVGNSTKGNGTWITVNTI